MKQKFIFVVIGAGVVTAAAAVSRKIYEIGMEAGKFSGFIDGVISSAEMSADVLRKNIEITDKYNELSDKYDELVDDYNELREELENKEFYGN